MPMFASDYTYTRGGETFLAYMTKLLSIRDDLIEDLIDKFNGGPLDRNSLGLVSVFRYIEIAE